MGKFGEMKIKFGEKIRKKIIIMWKWAKKKLATLIMRDVKDDSVLQVSGQEPSTSSKYPPS